MTSYPLSGDPAGDGWEIRGCLGDTWRWLGGPGRPAGEAGWFAARVPGSVPDDLCRAGRLPDPYHSDNSLASEWVPQRTWLYRREIAGAPLAQGERAVLRFGGVDHDATVLVDGREVAHHSGMFVPFEVDVTEQLADGGPHLLAVAVHPAPPSEPQVGRTDRVRIHKSRMGYGWDFCPRMIHQGIWKPVTLEIAGPVRLVDAHIGAETGEALDTGEVRVSASVEARAAGLLRVEVRSPDGEPVAAAEHAVAPGERSAVLGVPVPGPELWWPNGHGDQPLYEVEVTLADTTGRTVGVRRAATGFRRIGLVPNPGAPAGALPYTLEVNGRRIHLKGWNWVPHDAHYGVPRPERLEHLLRLAADAHVTLLRVWGGGLIETADFYRWCDRLGLLVWQEFSLSSSGIDSVPAADGEYVALMEREARALVPALRPHPSLAIWGPGNELHDTAAACPLDERSSPVVAALADVVAELDPDRAWLPGSPSGAAFLNRLDLIAAAPDAQHDVHGPWEHQGIGAQHELYDAGTCLLHSEFGVEGMANARTWQAVVPEGRRWPTGRDNPLMEHLGAWWNNTPLVQASFGGRLTTPDLVRRASQQLQYDGLRYAVEANLRRAPRSSGTIPWQFDEPFPNAWCTAAVDHRGDPKPAYHGVRRAYRPAHVCARFPTQAWHGHPAFTAELWAWDQHGRGRTVTARLTDAYGELLAEHRRPLGEPTAPGPHTSVPAARAGEWEVVLDGLTTDVFLLDLALYDADGSVLAANRWLHTRTADLSPLLDLPAAHIEATAGPDHVTVAHTGGAAALGLVLTDARPITDPGWAAFGDNMLDLLPGDRVRIPVQWRHAPAEGRTVRLEGWNTGVVELL
ncbi:glycoside hydrolase family 2 TIM barrel-domain containing protein [Streptomyces sp. NPDC005925]|uniref:glycoside hydrolase family 2 protein n=1 Tax=Streptomyces sp. NPDC005925 TaxID=3157172 RepID=UPI0033CC68A9